MRITGVLGTTVPLFLTLFMTGCQSKIRQADPLLVVEPGCRNTYERFYAKNQLDFRIIFGYKDARPARYVGDRYEESFFIEKITSYGFVRSKTNPSLFEKELLGFDGRKKSIHLTLLSSSTGPDDDENRRDPFQKWKSELSEESFLTGLTQADLIFYYGHSRDGGGPSFSPPRLLPSQHVDYGWYRRSHSGLDKMTTALGKGGDRVRIVGLYSCISDRLFSKALLNANPSVALMTSSSLLYYADALDGMMETLKDVLETKCQPDFHPAGTHVTHFFLDRN